MLLRVHCLHGDSKGSFAWFAMGVGAGNSIFLHKKAVQPNVFYNLTLINVNCYFDFLFHFDINC